MFIYVKIDKIDLYKLIFRMRKVYLYILVGKSVPSAF